MSFIRGVWNNMGTVLWKLSCSRLPLQTKLRITSEGLTDKHTYISLGYFSTCIIDSQTEVERRYSVFNPDLQSRLRTSVRTITGYDKSMEGCTGLRVYLEDDSERL